MSQLQKATLANGCFWCTEAIFQRIRGVETVESGYAGGVTEHPTYEDVHSGETSHAEALQMNFDPKVVSYETLLHIFFATHDPTTLNRQGNDVGTQYRSEIFYHSDEQKEIAESVKEDLDKSGQFKEPIVTAISKFTNFYSAEDEHKSFYDNNPNYSYCRIIIDPKIHKLLEKYSEEIKEEYK